MCGLQTAPEVMRFEIYGPYATIFVRTVLALFEPNDEERKKEHLHLLDLSASPQLKIEICFISCSDLTEKKSVALQVSSSSPIVEASSPRSGIFVHVILSVSQRGFSPVNRTRGSEVTNSSWVAAVTREELTIKVSLDLFRPTLRSPVHGVAGS